MLQKAVLTDHTVNGASSGNSHPGLLVGVDAVPLASAALCVPCHSHLCLLLIALSHLEEVSFCSVFSMGVVHLRKTKNGFNETLPLILKA